MLAQVFKIMRRLCYFPDNIIQIQPLYSSRLARTDTIHCPFARTNYYYHFFVPSSIAAWNALEDSPVLCTAFLHSSIQYNLPCSLYFFNCLLGTH